MYKDFLRHWLTLLASVCCLLGAGHAYAAPSYMSYFGLGWNIPEAQDHVNLYWAVSWVNDSDEIISEIADAKARGMRAIVHTEFAFFTTSGSGSNCSVSFNADAVGRWNSFAQALAKQNLLGSVAAFYPLDEPDLCNTAPNDVLNALSIIRAHPLTAGIPIAAIFTCDIAQKYGGIYAITGGHKYGAVLRSYDWVGFDCYGVGNIFADPAWTTLQFDTHCLCIVRVNGPSYYDNFKAQLDLSSQRLILVPQGFISADGPPDDPQLFAGEAGIDPSVILMAPFTWFDLPYMAGVRSQPALAQQWRNIGRAIAMSNPPNGNPSLPAAIPPRLTVTATDIQHFSVYDFDCNTTQNPVCSLELDWQAPNSNVGTQLFLRQSSGPPIQISCAPAMSYSDLPWINAGVSYTFDLYQLPGCPTTLASGATPIASISMTLALPQIIAPGAPTAVSAVGGNALATITFSTPPSDGGSPIALYTATAYPGGMQAVGKGSPIVFGGLANGVNYAFTVTASNSAGTSLASGISNTVIPFTNGPATVVEFYNKSLDHYFITWAPDEIAKLDAGIEIVGWARSGKSFMSFTTPLTGSSPVCRFYIPPPLGDSHFFGRGPTECAETAAKNPSFILEDPAFMQMYLPTAGVCPSNTAEVYRVFDNRLDANHRYMTDPAIRDQMVAQGWVAEGDGPDLVVMCAPQ